MNREGHRAFALDAVDLAIERDESFALVGESGSGKTTLGMAIGRLLPGEANREAGDLLVEGRSVFDMSAQDLRALRREKLGFVFQNPMASLDPTMRVGKQVALALNGRGGVAELLARVELPEPERVARRFPHQLSGGMAQRVVIAMAIARSAARRDRRRADRFARRLCPASRHGHAGSAARRDARKPRDPVSRFADGRPSR